MMWRRYCAVEGGASYIMKRLEYTDASNLGHRDPVGRPGCAQNCRYPETSERGEDVTTQRRRLPVPLPGLGIEHATPTSSGYGNPTFNESDPSRVIAYGLVSSHKLADYPSLRTRHWRSGAGPRPETGANVNPKVYNPAVSFAGGKQASCSRPLNWAWPIYHPPMQQHPGTLAGEAESITPCVPTPDAPKP